MTDGINTWQLNAVNSDDSLFTDTDKLKQHIAILAWRISFIHAREYWHGMEDNLLEFELMLSQIMQDFEIEELD